VRYSPALPVLCYHALGRFCWYPSFLSIFGYVSTFLLWGNPDVDLPGLYPFPISSPFPELDFSAFPVSFVQDGRSVFVALQAIRPPPSFKLGFTCCGCNHLDSSFSLHVFRQGMCRVCVPPTPRLMASVSAVLSFFFSPVLGGLTSYSTPSFVPFDVLP